MDWSRIKTKKAWITLIVIIIIFIIVLPIALYIYNPSLKLTQSIFRILPYPVAVVDGKNIITTRTLISDTDAVKHFYQAQDFSSIGMRVDFSTEEGQLRAKIKEKDVLDKLIEDVIIKKVAKEQGIIVSEKEAKNSIVSLANKEGNLKTFEQNLKKLYGWNLDQFRKKVVISEIYLDKLVNHYIEKEETNSDEWKRIQEAQQKINEDDLSFCEATAEYSTGESAENCGEVGWFEAKHLEPEIATAIVEMKVGDVSGIIKSSLGYHIIFLEEKRQIEKEGVEVEEVKLKQVFIANGGFVNWIRKEKGKHRVWILMKDYKWNKNQATVEFRDDRLEKKEDYLKTKSEGDPIFY